jgi:hypothetical protein
MRVIWAPRALTRVTEIARYIAADRPRAASCWVTALSRAGGDATLPSGVVDRLRPLCTNQSCSRRPCTMRLESARSARAPADIPGRAPGCTARGGSSASWSDVMRTVCRAAVATSAVAATTLAAQRKVFEVDPLKCPGCGGQWR